MDLIVSAFVFFIVVISIMSVGVLFGRSPIKGTCGGLNQLMGSQGCEICGGDTRKCDNATVQSSSSNNSLVQHYTPKEDVGWKQ